MPWQRHGLCADRPRQQPEPAETEEPQTPLPPDAIRCGLGWMLDRPDVMCRALADSYRHTGFTGPVLLVMPACRAVVVLLCNRTYPRRSAERSHFPVMTALVDAVLAACPAC